MNAKSTYRVYTLNDLPRDTATDWKRISKLTEEEIEAAALSDPDAQPWTKEDLAKFKKLLHSIKIS